MTATIRRSPLVVVACAITVLLLFAPRAGAAWGELDTTFAAPLGYTSVLPAGNIWGTAMDVQIQPDGKILVAGEGGDGPFTEHPMIQRFLLDGTLDPTFGSGGTMLLAAPAALADLRIVSIGLQGDGKIVCVADTNTGGAIFRVTSTGQLDTTFASPLGYVALADDRPTDVLIHSSGDIYTAANVDLGGEPVLRRFTGAGTEIGTFRTTSTSNLAGVTFSDYEPVFLREYNSAIFMVTSSETVPFEPRFFAAKLNTTGSLDNTWGTAGKATVSFSISSVAADVVVQSSGALVIVGGTQTMGDSSWTLARFNPAGTLDPTFAGGGKQELNFTTSGDYARTVTTMPNGNLVVTGAVEDLTRSKSVVGLRMMSPDGVPQAAFGPDGMRYFAQPNNVGFNSVVAQADGKIVGAGGVTNAPDPNVPITARFQNDYVPPPVPVLGSKISSPKGSKIAAKKLKRFSGSATTTSGTIAKVEIALQRVDSKLLKKKRQCSWLSSSKVKFKKIKAVSKKCSTPKWLKASGTSKWSYKISKKLPKGKYVLQVRAKAGDGTVQAKPAIKRFKVT